MGAAQKRLLFVNGTMGAGKSATCAALLKQMQPAVFLDGDWCWNMQPFLVNEETKAMVTGNIVYLLRNFPRCSAYETVIFGWVMHQREIIDGLLEQLQDLDFRFYLFTLTLSEGALRARLEDDIANGVRSADVIERSVARLPLYDTMDSIKIDVSTIRPEEAAQRICREIERREEP